MLGKFMVRFNNHGEVLRHYTVAPSEAKAKSNAAHVFASLLGVSVGTVVSRMKGRSDVLRLSGDVPGWAEKMASEYDKVNQLNQLNEGE